MDPESRKRIRELMDDPKVQAIAAEAPPPPKAAIELLKANGFPFRRASERTEAAA